jgi:uncharacterized protein with PIN domain
MLAQQAVELQKAGMSFTEIGNHCGVTANQVSRWLQYMGYDAATYHLPAIIQAIEAGKPFYRALQQCGLTTGGTQKLRVATMLAERGIHLSRVSAVTIKREPDTRPRCLQCEILLEPYDPTNVEQQRWQNGTRDGLHCTGCESRVEGGGGWLTRMPLLNSEETANMNLGEVAGYGY